MCFFAQGTGKSVVKETIQQNASKRVTVVSIARTLHTYTNIVKILSGQPSLISNMSLKVNEDIKSRVTFSTMMPKLNSDQIREFILKQLDAAELGHNTFNDDALALIIRSSEGIIRKSRNLCLSTLLETVRLRKRIVDLETVNRVLIQPHWRTQTDFD
jgi:MSHA biogenesis protein MshM